MFTKYTIQNGDTLSRLAKKFGVSVLELAKMNNIEDPDKIYIGDALTVPDLKAKALQQQVQQLMSQMVPQQPPMQGGPNNGIPPQLQEMLQGRQQPAPQPMPVDPRRDAIEPSMPEALMMGAPGMMRAAGGLAAGGLGALAKAAPKMGVPGRIPPPAGYSNIAPVGNNPAFNSGLVQAMMASGKAAHPRGIPPWLQSSHTQNMMRQNPKRMLNRMSDDALRKETKFNIGGKEDPFDVAMQEQFMRRMFGQ